MTIYPVINQLADNLAGSLDARTPLKTALDYIESEIEESDEGVTMEDVLSSFEELYQCNPETYIKNIDKDYKWEDDQGVNHNTIEDGAEVPTIDSETMDELDLNYG